MTPAPFPGTPHARALSNAAGPAGPAHKGFVKARWSQNNKEKVPQLRRDISWKRLSIMQYGIPSPFDSHFLVLTLAITFAIQLSVWVVSAIARCESAFDAAGAVNYVVVALLTFGLSGTWAPRQALSTGAVVLCRGWLGIFLLIRVIQRKGDVRFEEYRKHWWQVRRVREAKHCVFSITSRFSQRPAAPHPLRSS